MQERYSNQQKGRNPKISNFVYLGVLLVGVLIAIGPFYWMVSSALKHPWEILRIPPTIIPQEPTLENFVEIWTITPLSRFFLNSLFVTTTVTIIVLFSSSLIGYVLGKIAFPGATIVLILILMSLMVPIHVLMVPMYTLMIRLNWIDSYWALIVPLAISPTCIFFFRQFMYSIPSELTDAARIDGCTEFGIYWHIIAPLSKPVFAAMAIFKFLWTWEAFLWPLIVLHSKELYTIPLGLTFLSQHYWVQYELVMAASSIVVLPVLIVYLFFQRYFIRGITLTGIKI